MFAIAAGLALFGAMMVYSASAMIALRETRVGDASSRIFTSSSAFTLVGLGAMFVVSRVDYRLFKDRRSFTAP